MVGILVDLIFVSLCRKKKLQNIFLNRKISKVFDLKGSLRGRFTQQLKVEKEKKNADTSGSESQSNNTVSKNQNSSKKVKKDESGSTDDDTSSDDDMEGNVYESENSSEADSDVDESFLIDGKKNSILSDTILADGSKEPISSTLLDGDFLEFTGGRPLPLNDRAKAVFHMSILNVSANFLVENSLLRISFFLPTVFYKYAKSKKTGHFIFINYQCFRLLDSYWNR